MSLLEKDGQPELDAEAVVQLDGEALTPDAVVRVARLRVPAQLTSDARNRNARARATIAALVQSGQPLYGANTGVGALRDRSVAPEDREAFQWNLLRSHAADAGPPMPDEVVRAGMAVRANQLGAGGAGVADVLLDGLVSALARDDAPLVRELGSLGTGDLTALARIALAVLEAAGARGPGAPEGLLGLRDGLGFTSSNALTAGRACLLLNDARKLQDQWLRVAALSFEAAAADPVVLASRVQKARGSAGQIAVGARMREMLGVGDSPSARDAGRREDPARARRDPEPRETRPPQGPYPFRVLPQVDGVFARSLTVLEEVLIRELNATAENALIDQGEPWPNGNFHAAELASALDGVRGALAGSASLIAARLSSLLDPRITDLAPFLAGVPGLHSGLMMLEYTAHDAAAEARSLAGPVAGQPAWVSLGIESHASLAACSARRLGEQLQDLRVLIAAELLAARRAFELSGRRPNGPGTVGLYEAAAGALPTGLEDRDLGDDLRVAMELLADAP